MAAIRRAHLVPRPFCTRADMMSALACRTRPAERPPYAFDLFAGAKPRHTNTRPGCLYVSPRTGVCLNACDTLAKVLLWQQPTKQVGEK